jgi:hypothetical protein
MVLHNIKIVNHSFILFHSFFITLFIYHINDVWDAGDAWDTRDASAVYTVPHKVDTGDVSVHPFTECATLVYIICMRSTKEDPGRIL